VTLVIILIDRLFSVGSDFGLLTFWSGTILSIVLVGLGAILARRSRAYVVPLFSYCWPPDCRSVSNDCRLMFYRLSDACFMRKFTFWTDLQVKHLET
jgi:hypothetical protein